MTCLDCIDQLPQLALCAAYLEIVTLINDQPLEHANLAQEKTHMVDKYAPRTLWRLAVHMTVRCHGRERCPSNSM